MIFGNLFGRKSGLKELAVSRRFEMFSRTATIVVFDVASLSHRVDDDVDWWSEPEPEIAELHARNLVIAGLEANDWYDVSVKVADSHTGATYSLRVPSGNVFVGPGEEISGGGCEPGGEHGGIILTLEPGDYSVSFARTDREVSICLTSGRPFSNDHYGPILI